MKAAMRVYSVRLKKVLYETAWQYDDESSMVDLAYRTCWVRYKLMGGSNIVSVLTYTLLNPTHTPYNVQCALPASTEPLQTLQARPKT